MEETSLPSPDKQKRNLSKIVLILLSVLTLSIFATVVVYESVTKPALTQEQTTFVVEKGMSVKSIAEKAKLENIVQSEFVLYTLLTVFHDPTNIHAGRYIITYNDDVYSVAEKLASKKVEQDLVSITIPEGVRLATIAEIGSKNLKNFDPEDYLTKTKELEGYLFPETYFVPESFTAEDLVTLQRNTYEEKISPLRAQIEASNFSEYEVLILASIIEREANDEESMKTVSGILQNRLEIGMALQADATIDYVIDSPLNELPEGTLAKKLREIDSPYNTYLNRGLTPTPIGNPGLMAIKAVLEPTESDYFYYITDNEGEFHYSKTLAEHNRNISNYLR